MTYNEAEARDLVATFLKTLQYLHNRKIVSGALLLKRTVVDLLDMFLGF